MNMEENKAGEEDEMEGNNWVLLWRERSEPKLKTTIHFRLSLAALPLKRPEPDVPSVRSRLRSY